VGPSLTAMRIPPDIAEVFRSPELQPPSGAPASAPP
jgi:hypothetical protein